MYFFCNSSNGLLVFCKLFCAAIVGIGVVFNPTLAWYAAWLYIKKTVVWQGQPIYPAKEYATGCGRVRKFKAQVLMGQIPLFAIKAHPQRLLESLGMS